MQNYSQFVELKFCKKIWAIGSIHSHVESFESIKKHILDNFSINDKLVFLGNIIGLGKNAKQTLYSVLDLRKQLMLKYYLNNDDLVFLRGAQEEMFLKLLQLQTAPNPYDIVTWMFDHGVDTTLNSYGFGKDDIINISLQGTLPISKLTSKINSALLKEPGHKQYFANLKHAAFSHTKKILFLNRGVDVSRPLSAQNDCFWWGYQNFSNLIKPYNTFIRIVRGYKSSENNHLKDSKNRVVCSLFHQPLDSPKIIAGIFNDSGEIIEIFESQ